MGLRSQRKSRRAQDIRAEMNIEISLESWSAFFSKNLAHASSPTDSKVYCKGQRSNTHDPETWGSAESQSPNGSCVTTSWLTANCCVRRFFVTNRWGLLCRNHFGRSTTDPMRIMDCYQNATFFIIHSKTHNVHSLTYIFYISGFKLDLHTLSQMHRSTLRPTSLTLSC